MWEVIFGVIPIIFVCSAVALVLINFDSVVEYFIYTFASATRKRHSHRQDLDPAFTNIPSSETTPKLSFNPFLLLKNILIRIFNLFTAIFLPKISLDLSFPQEITRKNDPTNNYLTQIAEKQVQQLNIKSYSAMPISVTKNTNTYTNLPTIDTASTVPAEIILPKQKQQLSNHLNTQSSPTPTEPTHSVQDYTIYAPITSKSTSHLSIFKLLRQAVFYLTLSTPLFLIVTIIVLYILERSSGTTNANILEWLTTQITDFVEKYLNSSV